MPPRHLVRILMVLVALSIVPFNLVNGATQRPRPRRGPAQQPSKEKALTNADVVRMAKNAFSEDSIINTIQSNKTQFDLSVDALIALKSAGVSERIISVMQSAQGTGRGPQVSRAITPVETRPAPAPPPAVHLEQPYVLVAFGGTR